MSAEYAQDLWRRAGNALRSAEALLPVSADDAASRAYYGGHVHVEPDDARSAVETAGRVLSAVRRDHPELDSAAPER